MFDAIEFETHGPGADERTGRWRRHLPAPRVLLTIAAVVVLLAVLIPAFAARVYAIPSSSMETTLHGCPGCDNDRVLVDRMVYWFTAPEPGDVVVFAVPPSWRNPELPAPPTENASLRLLRAIPSAFGMAAPEETDFVKRVIAVGGQTVACCDSRNRLLVDNRPVDEPFVYFDPDSGRAAQSPFAPVRLAADQLWVMGDNRNNSIDSRAADNGPLPLDAVIGKVRMIVLPLARFGGLGTPGS